MKTLAEEQQLDTELQELYLLSKHWISDIDFVEDEIRVFKTILNKYLWFGLDSSLMADAKTFKKTLTQHEVNTGALKNDVLEFLKYIEPVVSDQRKRLGVNMLEVFIDLESRMKKLPETIKREKKQLLLLTEDAMRAVK